MTSKVCTKCGEEKPLEEYGRRRTGKDGRFTQCRSCTNKRARQRRAARRSCDHGLVLFDYARTSAVHGRCDHSIDLQWSRDRIANLDGRCELTGWRLDLGPRKPGGKGHNPYAPSFDRIDNSRGYHPDNIRVVCAFVNFMMQTYTDEMMEPVILALRDAAYATPPPLF